MTSSVYALNAANFFMADVRDGLGPFLGVFLQQKNWSPASIGLVMTIGGYAGMVATAPLGALVDATHAKRAIMIGSALTISVASMAILFMPSFPATAASQIATGIAGAAVVPAIAGITLGLVRQAGYALQLGRNEAFNHAGNVFAAFAGGGLGYLFGLQAVFYVLAAMALASVIAVLAIAPRDIDNKAARGLSEKAGAVQSSLGVLFTCKPLIGLTARILDGTGRVNVGLGVVMTAQCIGARLEPRVALLLWIGLTPLMAEACDINTKLMKRTRA
jgi:predicted MFS family arabinose efflux permease